MGNELRQYRELKVGEQIYVGCDCADGCGDWCVAQFFSSKRFDFPLVWSSPEMTGYMTDELFPILNWIYDETGNLPLVAYERAKGGASELERLAKLNKRGKFDIYRHPITDNDSGVIVKSDRLGWDTTTATRPQMLSHLKEAIDSRLIKIYDKPTIDELFSFIRVQHSNAVKAEAEKNAHDDLVMALAIAYEIYLQYPDLGRETSSVAASLKQYNRRISQIESGAGGYG